MRVLSLFRNFQEAKEVKGANLLFFAFSSALSIAIDISINISFYCFIIPNRNYTKLEVEHC